MCIPQCNIYSTVNSCIILKYIRDFNSSLVSKCKGIRYEL